MPAITRRRNPWIVLLMRILIYLFLSHGWNTNISNNTLLTARKKLRYFFLKKASIPEKNRKCRLICSMTPRSCYVVTSSKIKVKGTVAGDIFYAPHFPVSQLRRGPWCNFYDTKRCE